MDHPNYLSEGLYWLPNPYATPVPKATGWVPAGIAIRGNTVYSVCQDDNYLRAHRIAGYNTDWPEVLKLTLPDGGTTKHFRGCAWYGNELLVGNENNNKVYSLQLKYGSVTTKDSFDVSAYMADLGNEAPYGLWFWD